MRFRILIVPFTLLMINNVVASENENTQSADSSTWVCKFCRFEQGSSNDVNAGLGYVSKDSYKFGEYNGLKSQGLYFIGDATSRYRNFKNANYWDINISDLGLDTRSLQLQGGKQGLYSVSMFYKELPHYLSDTAKTPFTGTGGNTLTLPAGWVNGGSTTNMTTLNNSLSDVNLETKRTQWGAAATYLPLPKWKTSIRYRHETREGKQRIAGSFYFDSVELVQPIDYTTDLIDATASYSTKAWQVKLAYQASTFRNQNDALSWQNPYLPIVAGAGQGELSLPPDNQYHQLLASTAIRVSEKSTALANIAVSRMTQNEGFLAATTNSSLTVSALPANSLHGRVDSTDAKVKWITDFNDKFTIDAAYQYRKRDNKTPQHTYDWVITDVNLATPRTNLPYSYRRNTFKTKAQYKLDSSIKTLAGYDYKEYKRTYQEIEFSRENSLWASMIIHSQDNADVTMKLAHAVRKVDGYQVIAGVDNPENPLLRKYNMANRKQDTLGIRTDIATTAQSTLGFNFDLAFSDYPDSSLGLTSSDETNLGVDFSTQITTHTSANFFISREKIISDISGSQSYNVADWSGGIEDYFNTSGIGFNRIMIDDKLDVGADYVYIYSVEKTTISGGSSNSNLPDLTTKHHSMKIYGNYHISEAMVLNGSYWYEKYSSNDWALDGVAVDSISNGLTLGQQSPTYNINVVMLSIRYRF